MNIYWQRISSVLAGSIIAQIIPVVGSFLVARLYAPDDFGVFATWLGWIMLVSVILTGRFETALAVVEDGILRRHAMLSTLLTAGIFSLIATGLIFILALMIPKAVEKLSFFMLLSLIPTALAVAMAQTWQSWAAAEGKYAQLSFMRISQAAAVTICQIAIGIKVPNATALAAAHSVGVTIGLGISIYLMPPGRFPNQKTWQTVREFWRKYNRFPLMSLPADTLNTAANQLPIILVASRFGAEKAGLLAMTFRVLGAPIGLVGKSVLDVFKRHAAQSYRENGQCKTEYLVTLQVLAAGSIFFCLVMIMFGETFFALVFGENWRGAGTIAVWLLPLFTLRFIASPLSYMVYIAGKQYLDLAWQVALMVVTFTALGIPKDPIIAIQIYSAGYSFLYILYLIMSYRFSLGALR